MPCETPHARDLVLWCYSVFLKVHNTFMSWIFMCCPEIFGVMPLKWFRETGFPLILCFLVHNVSVVAVIFFHCHEFPPWCASTPSARQFLGMSFKNYESTLSVVSGICWDYQKMTDTLLALNFTYPADIAYFTEGQKPFQCQLSEWLLNIVISKLIKFSLF